MSSPWPTVAIFNVTTDSATEELEQIFREHSRMVYRTAYSVTGTAQDAEDIVQNLFLHFVHRGIPAGLKENPKAYLYRASVNLALNAVKARPRHCAAGNTNYPEPAAAEDNREEALSELQQRLVDAMSQLNPRTVEMLVLRYEHNYSDAEIAKMLGKSRGMVAVTMYRARARLKRLLRPSSSGGKL